MRCSVLLLPLLLTSADAFSSLSRAMVSRVGGPVAACPAATSSLGRLTGAAAPALRAPPRRARAIAPSMGLIDREVITEGDGKTFPKNGDTLTVHYEGTLARGGTKFDSSSTEQEIHGSSPCMGNFFAIRTFFLMGSGTRNLVLDTHWTCWKFRNRGIELFEEGQIRFWPRAGE